MKSWGGNLVGFWFSYVGSCLYFLRVLGGWVGSRSVWLVGLVRFLKVFVCWFLGVVFLEGYCSLCVRSMGKVCVFRERLL